MGGGLGEEGEEAEFFGLGFVEWGEVGCCYKGFVNKLIDYFGGSAQFELRCKVLGQA